VEIAPASRAAALNTGTPGVEIQEAGMAPVEWTGQEPALQFASPFLGRSTFSMLSMARHLMVTGETGSGKTRSFIVPPVKALLGYGCPRPGPGETLSMAALIFNVKGDFAQHTRQSLKEHGREQDLICLTPGSAQKVGRVFFFEGESTLPITDKLSRIGELAPPAWSVRNDRNSSWRELASNLLTGAALAEESARKARGISLLAQAAAHIGAPAGEESDSFFLLLERVLKRAAQEHKVLVNLHKFFIQHGPANGVPASACSFLSSYVATADLLEQFNYTLMSLDLFLSFVNHPDVRAMVDFDLFSVPDPASHLSMYRIVEEGRVLLFSPGNIASESVTLLGKVLKAVFFRAVFKRQKNRERGVLYVADEAHRFISVDEASFLDRCRAFRAICILATQSVASLRFALHATPGGQEAIDCILNNVGNKAFLRSSDPHTGDLVRKLIPYPPGGDRHIVDVRPLTSLPPGSAYFLLSDGSWGRCQHSLA
jgi:hypothetical protein